MDFFKNFVGAVSTAKEFVVEKNRRTALINRLRSVVKCEEQNADREYMALGRYYYHNLRDAGNPITEAHCSEIDSTEKRLEQAISHLEKIYNEESADSMVQQIDLSDAKEIEPLADMVVDGLVDESVDAAAEGVIDEAVEAATEGENKELPFEG